MPKPPCWGVSGGLERGSRTLGEIVRGNAPGRVARAATMECPPARRPNPGRQDGAKCPTGPCATPMAQCQRLRTWLHTRGWAYGCCGQRPIVGFPVPRLQAQPESNQKTRPDKRQHHGDGDDNEAALVICGDDILGGNDLGGHGGRLVGSVGSSTAAGRP